MTNGRGEVTTHACKTLAPKHLTHVTQIGYCRRIPQEMPAMKTSKGWVWQAAAVLVAALGLQANAAPPGAVEASKKEKGLVIYGNVASDNFAPIVAAFRKKYPWIEV